MKTSDLARKFARELRTNPTEAELILWTRLRNRQIMNYRFLRQHPIFFQIQNRKRFFIADFYCHDLKLIIEVDGDIHRKQKDYDIVRTDLLKIKKNDVIRFKNEDVLLNLDEVILRLMKKLESILGSGKD